MLKQKFKILNSFDCIIKTAVQLLTISEDDAATMCIMEWYGSGIYGCEYCFIPS